MQESLITHPTGGKPENAGKPVSMNLKHYDIENHAHFITFNTHRRLAIIDNKMGAIIIETLRHFIKNGSIFLAGYVIMPNHVHLVMIPGNGIEIGRVVGEIKRISARAIHDMLKSAKRELLNDLNITRNRLPRFTFWQKRCFDYNCRTEEEMWEKVNYCHNNPVTKKLVACPEDWKWSSCRWYKKLSEIALELNLPVA